MDALAALDGVLGRVERIEAMAASLTSAFSSLLEQAAGALAQTRDPAPVPTPGAPLLPDTRPYGVSRSGPPLPDGLTPELVSWRGVILNPAAMASFQEASRALGAPIRVTDSYRTHEQQAAAYARKPGVAAPPGSSYHERGLAIDVDAEAYGGYGSPAFRRVVEVLESLGWHRFDPQGEPWHFSYLVTG
ncbi:MAG: hypothetical protein KatS3mg014_2589 [Actinomycetota bacterium]|nr:MAG: hypothetical protein KatS3mg014_2589 [Actinomycetota bacterium]